MVFHHPRPRKIEKNETKMDQKVRGPSSKPLVFLPLSDSPPLILSLKGTLLKPPAAGALSGIYIYIYIPVATKGPESADEGESGR